MKNACCIFAFIAFILSLHRVQSAQISWVGGNGDWNTASNWSNGRIPTPTNEVVIDVPGDVTITHSSGAHLVRSIQCAENFRLLGGTLTVTSGVSTASAEFFMTGAATLNVIGFGTSFTAANATNIDHASLNVSGGALLSLPGLRSYLRNGAPGASWQASGAGSRLDLPALTNLSGPISVYCLSIRASNGGFVNVSNVVTIGNGHLCVLAEGTNSVVDFSRLSSLENPGDFASLNLEARAGGSILVPQLEDGDGVVLSLKPGGAVTSAQFRRLFGVALDGVSLALPGVTNIDRAALSVSAGAVLSLPGVRDYTRQGPSGASWIANGIGSTLNLSGLTNMTGPVSVSCLTVQALGGATINLSNLVSVSEGHLCVLSDGAGSTVDFGNLLSLREPADFSRIDLEARNGGFISAPRMEDGVGVTVTLKPGGTITTAQFRRLFGITLEGVSLHLPGLTNLDNGSLNVSGGAVLSLPNVRNYVREGPYSANWRASGVGSVLNLSGMTNLAGPASVYCLGIEALSGGTVRLNNLQTISTGHVCVLADGGGSLIDLPGLVSFADRSLLVSVDLEAKAGGFINVPELVDGRGVTITLSPGGSVSSDQFRQLQGIELDGVSMTLPGVTNIDNGSLTVSGGAQLTLPAVRSYTRLGPFGSIWQASGTNSVLNFPALTNLTGPVSVYCLSIQALSGGFVILSNVVTVSGGHVCVTADGKGSVCDLSALQRYSDSNSLVTLDLTAQNAGLVCVPSLVDGRKVSLTLRNSGFITVAQLHRIGSVTLDRNALVLPALTNADGANFVLSAGSVLTIPQLNRYSAESAVQWQASGAGSEGVVTDFGMTGVRVVHRGFSPAKVIGHDDGVASRVGGANQVSEGIVFVGDGAAGVIRGGDKPALAVANRGAALVEFVECNGS
jgi:hypothetical protein